MGVRVVFGLLMLLSLGATAALLTEAFDLLGGDSTDDAVDEGVTITPETANAILDEDQIESLRGQLLEDFALPETQALLNAGIEADPDYGLEEIEGTPNDDLIQTQPETVVTFGEAGDDTIVGTDSDYENIFGDEGDDVIFGEGGEDLLIGGPGDDLIAGGDGDDELYGNEGTDTLFGGAGDDSIGDAIAVTGDDPVVPGLEGINAGAGDDFVRIEDGINLVELGEGEDRLAVLNDAGVPGDHPVSVVTDFNPEEDALVLGVYDPDADTLDENALEISYQLRAIETSLGPATLVVPAVDDADLAGDLENANVSLAILVGLTPEDLAEADIVSVLIDDDHAPFAEGGFGAIARGAA